MAGLVTAVTLVVAAACLVVSARADRALRAFRLRDVPASVYRIPIMRLRLKLYHADGHSLVRRARRALAAAMIVLVLGLSLATTLLVCSGAPYSC